MTVWEIQLAESDGSFVETYVFHPTVFNLFAPHGGKFLMSGVSEAKVSIVEDGGDRLTFHVAAGLDPALFLVARVAMLKYWADNHEYLE